MKKFNSFDEYETWVDTHENCSDYEEIPVAIDDGFKIGMDMFTECKSWKTALRRFEKTFREVNQTVSGWVEGMRESAENGYFKDAWMPGCGWSKEEIAEAKAGGTYSWGIEQIDDSLWYIFLNISGIYRKA